MLESIKSKIILLNIFERIKTLKKLKLIKYNKLMQKKLNIDIKDYENFKYIVEMNKKFKLNVEDTNITFFQNTSEKNLEIKYLNIWLKSNLTN